MLVRVCVYPYRKKIVVDSKKVTVVFEILESGKPGKR